MATASPSLAPPPRISHPAITLVSRIERRQEITTTFQAALFDLDGTLLDTIADIATSGNAALARLDFPGHGREAYRRFVGEGRRVLAARILPEGERDAVTVDRLVALIEQEYNRHWADTTQPYPGIPAMLDALTDRCVRLAVLSNKAHPTTREMVSRLLPRWRFEIVSGAMPDVPLKPDPTAALGIARQMKLPPERFLYLGDSDIDMKTARGAGMYAVAALWGYGEREVLRGAGAQVMAEAPGALLDWLSGAASQESEPPTGRES
jgi:phosphoglycolate phosphatase